MRSERFDDRGEDVDVRLVHLHPLREVSAGREVMSDPIVELIREQGGDSADPGVRRLRHDEIVGLAGAREKRLGILIDDMAAGIREDIADARAKPLPSGLHHERLDLDRVQPLDEITGQQRVGRQARAEADIGDPLRSLQHAEWDCRGQYHGAFVDGGLARSHLNGRVGFAVGGNRHQPVFFDKTDGGGLAVPQISDDGPRGQARRSGSIHARGHPQRIRTKDQQDCQENTETNGHRHPRRKARLRPAEEARKSQREVDSGAAENHSFDTDARHEDMDREHHAQDGAEGIGRIDRADRALAGPSTHELACEERQCHACAEARRDHDERRD